MSSREEHQSASTSREELQDRGGAAPTAWAWRLVAAGGLIGTVALGAWLRWALVGAFELTLPFAHLRHTHSHLGYFGLLFPLAWLGWSAAGARIPARPLLWTYVASTIVSCIGFVADGYGVVAIAGSTVVAAIWLLSARHLLRRMLRLSDPLGVVPLGLVASLACVPPVAINLRTDPVLAFEFVATFLSGLLFLVIVPSALAGRGVKVGPWPLFLVAGALGALCLGVAPDIVPRVGLLVFAALTLAPVLSSRLELHVRVAWAIVALGLGAMAVGLLPNTRLVALGAIHFLILGPVLATLAPVWLKRPPRELTWWVGYLLWGTMAASLVLQDFGVGDWTPIVTAATGSGTVVWWVGVLLSQTRWLHPNGPRAHGGRTRLV